MNFSGYKNRQVPPQKTDTAGDYCTSDMLDRNIVLIDHLYSVSLSKRLSVTDVPQRFLQMEKTGFFFYRCLLTEAFILYVCLLYDRSFVHHLDLQNGQT